MIKINNLTVRNFMSVGNQTQAIDFDRGQLTLVLGENLDLGGDDSGARNGTGKTTIINGLSYAIYGQALTNIKRDNLINKINSKGMLCTVTFEKDGVKYHIERGRKPNLLRFSINDQEQELSDLDESQGDSRETQKAIEEVFGMKHEMFKHLIALNTYTEPFLSMKAAEQRAIIEQLLGITILSEKAEALKDAIKISKDNISTENTRIETVKASNERIQQSIESLIRKQRMWEEQKETALTNLLKSIDRLSDIDIDQEILNQRALADWNANKKEHESLASLSAKQTSALEKEQRILEKLERELVSLTEHKCHTCGQELHDSKHTEIMSAKSTQIEESRGAINEHLEELSVITEAISLLGELGACPAVTYDSLEQALNHKNTLGSLERDITIKTAEENPYDDQIVELKETAVQEIDWNGLNELVRVKDHQEFLHKLLTNKDSFIRKRIIDQNLSYLNARLGQYLDRIGLPHTVKFLNDLTVSIEELG